MARSQQAIADFIKGEVTPALGGRVDTEEYPSFVQTLENCFVDKHGGIKRRGGTQYVNDTRGLKVRLVPFIFSREDSYVMEFGDRYVRFFQDGQFVVNVGSVQSYLGDGSTTKFQFPHQIPSLDVVVYLITDGVPVLQTVVTDYVISAISTTANLLHDFSTTNWDGDATGVGSSWALPNNGTAVSPAGAEPVLRQAGVSLTHGAVIDIKVDVDAYTYTNDTLTDINSADSSLGETLSTFLDITTTKAYKQATIDFSIGFIASQPNTSDSVTAHLERGNDTIGWTQVATFSQIVDDIGVTWAISSALYSDVANGEIFRIRAQQSNDAAADIVVVGANSDSITGLFVVDPTARLRLAVRDNADGSGSSSKVIHTETAPFQWQITSDRVTSAPQPIILEFFTDPGLEITLSGIFANNTRDGWEIDFNVAPEVGQTVLIKDVNGATTTHSLPNINAVSTDVPFDIESPFTYDELDELYWAQANDIMWFCHPKHKPWRLTRTNHYDWVWEQPVLYGAPWDVPATSWQSSDAQVDYDFYFPVNAKVDMEVFYNGELVDPADWDLKSGETFPVAKASVITVVPAPPLGTTVLIAAKVSGYSGTEGYPRCVVFFQERLWFAATIALPQTLWGSRTADFLDFAVKGNKQVLQPDDAVEYTIAAYTHEAIEWLSSERVLVIGTSSTEHRLAPDEYIATDRLPRVSKMTDYGGSHQMPMYMGGLTCFVQQSGRQLRSFQQRSDMVLEEYESIELTWMASHMVKNLWIKEPYYALVPNNVAVMVREDGQLLTAMYDPSTGQMDAKDSAWSRQITDGTFESVCVIPTDFGSQIWVVVKRVIDGVVHRHVEFLTEDFYMDSAILTEAGAPETDLLTGLDHLEGKVCDILVDGAVHQSRPVVGGEIQLDWPGTNIVVGLHYRPKVVTMPFTDGNPGGTGQGKPGRWAEIWIRILDSAHPLVNGKRPPVRKPSTPMGISEDNTSGAIRVFNTGYSMDKQITIEQDLPLPFNVVNIYGTFHTGTG